MPLGRGPSADHGDHGAANALRKSEERFRQVVEASPSAIVMIRPSGHIEMVNTQTERLFGYARDELLGESVETLVPERFRSRHPAMRGTFFRDPQTRRMGTGAELFGLRKDGIEFPVEIGLNPIETDDGPMVLSTIIDLSARKRMEERFRLVVESAPNAMVMVSAAGRIEMVNTQAERIFGYTREEFLGQLLEMLVPNRFRALHAIQCERSFSSPHPRPMGSGHAFSAVRKDGTEFPVEIGLNPIETDDGPMILSVIVDISERVKAARALAQSEAEFRASFDGAAVGNLLADAATGRILRANRALARMLGRDPEDLIGRMCCELTWHDDVPADEADFARLVTGKEDAVVRELRYLRHDGTPFWARSSATIARADANSDRTIVVRSIEDIDTRYKAETALRSAKQELEQVVEERTIALEQRDLLLREVYHRVKNNLQLVDSLLMMQGRKIDDPQSKQALTSLRGRIFALGLVHQQLMGSGDLKTFDVVPFLDELSKNILEGGGTGGVHLSVEACTLQVGLDFAVPLGLLVTELVTNSLKHAFPDGTGTISVVLRNDTDEKLVLIVSDDGIGLADKLAADRLGAGLGTRIIGNLVGQLEGTMTVRNQNGMTTEIRIAMPEQSPAKQNHQRKAILGEPPP
jgi:PAS domain S-box-containing protein